MLSETLPGRVSLLHLQHGRVGAVLYHSGQLMVLYLLLVPSAESTLAGIHADVEHTLVEGLVGLDVGHASAGVLRTVLAVAFLAKGTTLCLGSLLHEHTSGLYFVDLVGRVVALHVFEELLALHEDVASEVDRVLLATHDVPGLLAHVHLHLCYLVDLNGGRSTCRLTSSSCLFMSSMAA